METSFYISKPGVSTMNIEESFGIRITSVRGLNPPQPKALHTREWASEHGVDVYIPVDSEGVGNRKRKASEVVISCLATDTDGWLARDKYAAFCDFCFNGQLTYYDTLQNAEVTLLYDSNKPAWYDFIGHKKIMFELTFLNPSGEVIYMAG
jgi:hypothetical protein